MHPWHFAMEYMPVNWSRLCANTKAHACSSLPMMHRQPVVTLCWSRDKNFSLAWQRAVYAYFICDTVRSPCTFFLPRCSQSPVPCLYIDFHINSFILQFVFGKIYCLPKGNIKFLHVVQTPNIKMLYIQLLCSIVRRGSYTTCGCWNIQLLNVGHTLFSNTMVLYVQYLWRKINWGHIQHTDVGIYNF